MTILQNEGLARLVTADLDQKNLPAQMRASEFLNGSGRNLPVLKQTLICLGIFFKEKES
jgi:hypothetical protein